MLKKIRNMVTVWRRPAPDAVSDFYPNDCHLSVSTWNIGAKASCVPFFPFLRSLKIAENERAGEKINIFVQFLLSYHNFLLFCNEKNSVQFYHIWKDRSIITINGKKMSSKWTNSSINDKKCQNVRDCIVKDGKMICHILSEHTELQSNSLF